MRLTLTTTPTPYNINPKIVVRPKPLPKTSEERESKGNATMAEHLASIFGTEKDRVNCPFYFKIGACRHGDRCSRLHTKPSISPTLLLANMYQRPDMITPGVDPQGQPLDPTKIQQHFEVIFVFNSNFRFWFTI